ncbi:MAG: redoxin domain-containing protein [Gemmatimonadota bacterium]
MIKRFLGLSAALAMLTIAPATAQEVPPLGPKDGTDLPPTDLERVTVGMAAPDFTLQRHGGGTVTLSQFRGAKRVILVFYRGHW